VIETQPYNEGTGGRDTPRLQKDQQKVATQTDRRMSVAAGSPAPRQYAGVHHALDAEHPSRVGIRTPWRRCGPGVENEAWGDGRNLLAALAAASLRSLPTPHREKVERDG